MWLTRRAVIQGRGVAPYDGGCRAGGVLSTVIQGRGGVVLLAVAVAVAAVILIYFVTFSLVKHSSFFLRSLILKVQNRFVGRTLSFKSFFQYTTFLLGVQILLRPFTFTQLILRPFTQFTQFTHRFTHSSAQHRTEGSGARSALRVAVRSLH